MPQGATMRKVLALLALIVSIFTLASCGTSHGVSVSNKNPSSFIGEWTQVNSSPDGWMTASISAGAIQVDLRSRDSHSPFWMGTFDTDKRPSGKLRIVSLGDQDAMKWQITTSTESKKTFTYDHGILSFQFSAMGSSTIVHLKKSKSAHIPTATSTTRKTFTNKPTAQTRSPKAKATKTSSSKVSTKKK
jgi:hypothetical protein